jgi:predicted transposase/invertase (TIGR01784 family)
VRTVYFAEFQFQKDEGLYHRFFCESLPYLYRNQELYDDWYGVLIFPSRTLEPQRARIHRALLQIDQVRRIYLNELGDLKQQSIEISLLLLTIASEAQMIAEAQQLIHRVERTGSGTLAKDEIIEIITKIVIYRFAHLSREEVETMLGIRFEESRVYQELRTEIDTKLRKEIREELEEEMNSKVSEMNSKVSEMNSKMAHTIRNLQGRGFSAEEIGEMMGLSLEEVQTVLESENLESEELD